MTQRRIFDFNKELSKVQNDLGKVSEELGEIQKESDKNTNDLTQLENEFMELGLKSKIDTSKFINREINIYSREFFNHLSKEIENDVFKEVNSNFNLIPPINKLDYTMALIIGFVGALVDMLIVKIPKNINYLGKFNHNGSEFTGWLKSMGIDENGSLKGFLNKLENSCKVSYDASTTSGLGELGEDVSGFYPKTHRLLSLGHDPFFGLIFGLIDIFNGSITLIDSKGVIHCIAIDKFQDIPINDKVFAPFLWLGHLASDVCTKMGLPLPGWGFTQLLQFGSFGENNRTVADLARWMYIEGYDLRHFITMSTVPGTIELLTRIYFKCTLNKDDLASPVYDKNLKELQGNVRLQKLLFTAHSVAASGNILKIILYQGNPLAFNTAELLGFIKQSIRIIQVSLRDKTGEKIIRNREQIDKEWNNNGF